MPLFLHILHEYVGATAIGLIAIEQSIIRQGCPEKGGFSPWSSAKVED
jgi:hypothetical protein